MRPYLRAANVTWAGLDLSDVKEMDFNPSEFGTYSLEPGDILLSEASGSPDEVGKPAIWNGQVDDCCFQNTLIRVRAESEVVPYLFYHLLSDARSGSLVERQGRGNPSPGCGTHIGLGCGSPAARRTASHRGGGGAAADGGAAGGGHGGGQLARAERLRQSILKQAFSGRLVPQDPGRRAGVGAAGAHPGRARCGGPGCCGQGQVRARQEEGTA